MVLDRRTCDRARRSRDARFDGKFFIAVTTTRIYCRPICPARSPKDEHIRYYPTAAAAQGAGFRPCLRCRPEASPGTPAWLGTSGVVSRGLRLITDGALDRDSVDALADRLGVTARHLRRLFVQHLGASPIDVALTRRVHFAKKLIDETRLPMAQVALAAGFGSLRRFNGEIRQVYARTPTQLRRLARLAGGAGGSAYRFRLTYRPPYDWAAMMGFLAARATPGVERVESNRYRRSIAIDGAAGTILVAPAEKGSALWLEVDGVEPRSLLHIVERVRRMFDLGADPAVINEQLGGDTLLKRPLAAHPGIRTPGAWDPFELSVRAILGQQISVSAATTIAGRVADRWGTPVGGQQSAVLSQQSSVLSPIQRLFPTPSQLADAPLEEAGIIGTRADALRALARAVAGGMMCFDGASTVSALRSIPGIGEWTAQYIAMRALSEPDSFPTGDLVLRRMAGDCTARELDRRSEVWRPWRSYAVMLLWQAARDLDERNWRTRHEDSRARLHRRGRSTRTSSSSKRRRRTDGVEPKGR